LDKSRGRRSIPAADASCGPFLQVLGEEDEHRRIGLLLMFTAEVVGGILQF
jgi:hypothetical protein